MSVRGFKSLIEETPIELRPLTILAGSNSSGKSSVMQPLLLLKQTLDAGYDPGPLKIDGPNAEFTAADQFFSRREVRRSSATSELAIGVVAGEESVCSVFKRAGKGPLSVVEMQGVSEGGAYVLREGMSSDELLSSVPGKWLDLYGLPGRRRARMRPELRRNRCFFDLVITQEVEGAPLLFPPIALSQSVVRLIRDVIHIPGLRGNPERLYPVTAVGPAYPGQFQTYVASIIAQWEASGEGARVHALGDDLRRMGLSWRVRAVPVSDTQVEIQVGRLPQAKQGGAWDLVSIADVGFGVSQVLPLLVALRAARPGQLVYVEQPEIHLHPRAQVALAQIIGEAVARGVRVTMETHSDLILLAIQTFVAQDKMDPDQVLLHWFSRDDMGSTHVSTAEVDPSGSFGEWPEDFGDVQLAAQDDYLTAAEPKLA
ncbi:MAG: DUF3696 domain-containing protein [Gaiellales bacterium]